MSELQQLRAENERLKAEVERLQAKLTEAHAANARLREAAKELLEVAEMRGDNELPHPADDPKLWSARMQDAWIGLEEALAAVEEGK